MSFLHKIFGRETQRSPIFATVGTRVKVVEPIDNLAGSGEVRIGAEMWAARSVSDDVTFAVGETVQIVALEGVRLICKQ